MLKLLLLLGLTLIHNLNALTAIPMNVTVQTGDTLNFTPFISGWDTTVTSVEIETIGPSHGKLHNIISWFDSNSYYLTMDTIVKNVKIPRRKTPRLFPGFKYIPDNSFTGYDTFTFRIQTSKDSSLLTKCAIRVTPPEPGNMSVLLVVNASQYSALQENIERLKNDLVNEGYQSRICLMTYPSGSFTAAHTKQLWDTLAAEYTKPSSMLAGAILIGRLPFVGGYRNYHESALWGLTIYEPDAEKDSTMIGWRVGVPGYNGTQYTPGFANIWVSRMWGQNSYGIPLGDEITLIKRMLQTNHDYRTGVSRLPHSASFYNMYAQNYTPNLVSSKYLDIWPEVYVHQPRDTIHPIRSDFKRGGELFETYTHGNEDLYNALVNASGSQVWRMQTLQLQDTPFPFRFMFSNGCHVGSPGGIMNAHLLVRNTMCVLSMGTTDYSYPGFYLCDTGKAYPPHTWTRNHLAKGDRFGRAWLRGNNILWMAVFHGDLSLKPMMAPANIKPLVNSVTAEKTGNLSWRFTVSATDNDDGITRIEWWANGYKGGTAEPDSTGSSTTFSVNYTEAKRCTVRVEVVDHYKARDYQNIIIKTDSGVISTTAEGVIANVVKTANLSLTPNPCKRQTLISWAVVNGFAGSATLEIFSLDGRSILKKELSKNTTAYQWHGIDSNGKATPSGIYLFRVKYAGRTLETKSILIQ